MAIAIWAFLLLYTPVTTVMLYLQDKRSWIKSFVLAWGSEFVFLSLILLSYQLVSLVCFACSKRYVVTDSDNVATKQFRSKRAAVQYVNQPTTSEVRVWRKSYQGSWNMVFERLKHEERQTVA
jgi:hypothetical protein